MWNKIDEKLDCLLSWYKRFKVPAQNILVEAQNLVVYLKKRNYPAPTNLILTEQDNILFIWDYDLVYLKIDIQDDLQKCLEIYFDMQLIFTQTFGDCDDI